MLTSPLISLLLTPAFACPTIATGTPSELSFDVARVAVARQNDRTTFTVSVNPSGTAQDFALVLPVPALLAEDEIRTLDPEIFARLDGYSAPRHVNDAGCNTAGDGGGGYDSEDSTGSADYGGVEVEAEYLIGEYGIVILSATESTGLKTWLDDNGYYLPAGADDRLQEYIDAGSYFLAAQVADKAALANGESLSPLQVSYDSEIFAIPIRLATLNSPGEQDMVIYSLTSAETAFKDALLTGIANYDEFDVPDTCIWGEASEDFGAFYEDRFTRSWEQVGDAGWTVEYAGTWGDCSVCSSVNITEEDVAALGFDESSVNHFLTRIRMRYTPEQATEDLMLYGSGIYETVVTTFADDLPSNRDCIDLCESVGDLDPEDDTDTSPDGDDTATTNTDDTDDTDDSTTTEPTDPADTDAATEESAGDGGDAADPSLKDESVCSCASSSRPGGQPVGVLMVLGALGLVLRRR